MADLALLVHIRLCLFLFLLSSALLLTCAQIHIEELGADGASEIQHIEPIIKEPELITAIKEEDAMKVERLVKKKWANVDERSPTGWTALMVASTRNDINYVKMLLDHRADVNAQENDGWTPLMFASNNGHTDTAKLLLDHRADASKRNGEGSFAHDLAFSANKTELGNLLGEIALKTAIINGEVNTILDIVIRSGIPPTIRSETGWDALKTVAAELDDPDTINDLLDRGADIDTVERDGWTALMFACANGHERTAQLLISRGANAAIKSVKGSDARELALEYANVDAVVSARIVGMLWKYGRAAAAAAKFATAAAAAGGDGKGTSSYFGGFW